MIGLWQTTDNRALPNSSLSYRPPATVRFFIWPTTYPSPPSCSSPATGPVQDTGRVSAKSLAPPEARAWY